MAWTREDLVNLANDINRDLTATKAKLADLQRGLAAMTPATMDVAASGKVKCPRCGVPLSGSERLAEHNYQVHDGPYPDHWIEQDRQLDELDKEMEREHNPA